MTTPIERPDEPSEALTDPRELLLGHLDVVRELADGTVGE